MKHDIPADRALSAVLLALTLGCLPQSLRAQTAPPPPPVPDTGAAEPAAPAPSPAEPAAPGEDQTTEAIVKLDPFVVDTTEDTQSYRAESTLAGSRVRTNLDDLPSSLSVITAKFLSDVAATDNQSLLVFVPNTEVGGVYGNYAGVGNTFLNGASESSTLLNPQNNTRVRGLDSADNTRDYFLSDIPWDSYDTDRVDLQRGPNSILFGIGSPAGIINSDSITPDLAKDSYVIQNRVGSFGSTRNSLDINQVIWKDELAFRVAMLDDDEGYQQKPAFNHDERLFAALRWDPKLFRTDSAHTTIRANAEFGQVSANNPRVLPPTDEITPFFDPDGINKTVYDPYYVNDAGINGTSGGNAPLPGLAKLPWVTQGLGSGAIQVSYNPEFFYSNVSGAPLSASQGLAYSWGAVSANPLNFTPGSGGDIGGFPFGEQIAIASYGMYALQENEINPTNASTIGGILGVYKDKSLTDPSIFNFFDNLIDGPTKFEDQHWHSFNLSLDQSFFNGRLAFNLVDNYQNYYAKEESNLSNPFISVDINANSMSASWPYGTSVYEYNGTGTPGTNPYAGYAYVAGNGENGNDSFASIRNDLRATVTGEVHASDFLGDTLLARILGRHVFTGLYQDDYYDTETRTWDRYALDSSYAVATSPPSTNYAQLTNGIDVIDTVTYLSSTSLFSRSSASGLGLEPITVTQSPSGDAVVEYWNNAWKWPTSPSAPGYVNPAAPWTNPTAIQPTSSNPQTQAANPANYVGWTTGTFPILNADEGDIDSLYTSGTKIRQLTGSGAFVWQGSFFDDMVATTFGFRRDEQSQRSGSAPISSVTGAATMGYGMGPYASPSAGNNISWGVVLHEPKAWQEALPGGTQVSLIYDYGANERVQNRYGFGGAALPNASGTTNDYGFQITTLHDRVSFKAIWYDTKVENANLSSVNSLTSTLGSNSYAVYQLEAAGTVGAMIDEAGFAGQAASLNWFWNWAYVDAGFPGDTGNGNWIGDASSQAFQSSPDTIAEKADVASWLAQMEPQSWWNAYNYNVNVAAAQKGDWADAIPGYDYATEGSGGLNPGGGGLINGVPPTGTANDESKGVELELVGQVTDAWNVSFNASKQYAEETSLGSDIVSFITAQHNKMLSPAGQLRLYWGGDNTIEWYYNSEVWAPFEFLEGSSGRLVPEMSPWHVNFTTNYAFQRGFLRGVNVGGAYRWQAGEILGYGILPDGSNLDINHPYWGPSLSDVDLWTGYGRDLGHHLHWQVQLNLKNVGEKTKLEPISVEPNGQWAQYRILEGTTWEVTNTISF